MFSKTKIVIISLLLIGSTLWGYYLFKGNPHDDLEFPIATDRLIDSLYVTQSYMIKSKTGRIKSFYWDEDDDLFINSDKIGSLNQKKITDKRFVNLLLFLRKQEILSAHIKYKTDCFFFDYSYNQNNEVGNLRHLYLSKKDPIKALKSIGYEIVDRHPPLYLLKINIKK